MTNEPKKLDFTKPLTSVNNDEVIYVTKLACENISHNHIVRVKARPYETSQEDYLYFVNEYGCVKNNIFTFIINKENKVKVFDPNKPVRTRGGLKARIILTDAKGTYPIVALILKTYSNNEELENVETYTKDGYYLLSEPENNLSLVNIDEDEQ